MVLWDETETPASSPVRSVDSQTRSVPEEYAKAIRFNDRENLSKKK